MGDSIRHCAWALAIIQLNNNGEDLIINFPKHLAVLACRRMRPTDAEKAPGLATEGSVVHECQCTTDCFSKVLGNHSAS